MSFNTNIPKMGYVLAYKSTGSWVNRMIIKKQLEQGFSEEASQYTHVEVSGGGKHSIDISPPLSKLIDITKTHKGRYISILKYRAEDFAIKRYKVAYFSAALCSNRPYDFSGIFSFVFKWLSHNNRLYFCSEGVLAAFKMVYPRCMPLPAEKAMPAHFVASNQFETVWEGIIK
jgi:hypothetical protein